MKRFRASWGPVWTGFLILVIAASALVTPQSGAAMFIGEYPELPPELIEALRGESPSPHFQEVDWDTAMRVWFP